MRTWSIRSVSEDSIIVTWSVVDSDSGDLMSSELNERIATISKYLIEHHSQLIINLVPAYKTLMVQYDILTTTVEQITAIIEQLLSAELEKVVIEGSAKTREIPVFYDSSVAADLMSLCKEKNLTVQELVEVHTSTTYHVYAVGFLPGFAYLGYVPELLTSPRHTSFRGNVPAGSVGIADRQTAVYPDESPGGWQIIGRTPMAMLQGQSSLLQVGDKVQFVSIDQSEYLALGGC